MTEFQRRCNRLARAPRKGELSQKFRDGLLTLVLTALLAGFIGPH